MKPWARYIWTIAIIAIITGCKTTSTDLFRNGYLHVNQTSTDTIRAMWFSVSEQKHGIEVSGVLKRFDRGGLPVKAHVDIDIVAPDGKVLSQIRSQDLYVPRHRIGGGAQRYPRFTVFMDVMPPADSIIQAVVHIGSHT